MSKLAKRFSPKIFCNEVTGNSLTEFQDVGPGLITTVKPGDVIQEEGLTVEVLKGVHVDFAKEYIRLTGRDMAEGDNDFMDIVKNALMVMLGSDRIPQQFEEWMMKYPQGEQLNFVFEPKGGKRIYMAGSYPDPIVVEAARHANAHITLLQVLPGHTLRGIEEQTASVAIASGCKIVVPQHHDLLMEGGKETDLSELKKILADKGDMAFQEFVPGKWYGFD